MGEGVLAGYPVVDMKATLVDGSYHTVDSSEMAFKVAASAALKRASSRPIPSCWSRSWRWRWSSRTSTWAT